MLFSKFIGVSVRSQMQYPSSFLMLIASHFFGTFIDVVGLFVLFDRFQMIKGWTLCEVGLIYGIVQMGFALSETFARGFDTFSYMIKHGDFDRVLLRPLNPLFQIAFREIHIMRIGRFLQGLTVLIWSAKQLPLSFFSLHTVVIAFSVLGTASVFYGLLVIRSTLCFWTVEALELVNIATHGGLQAGQYPITIYNKPIQILFTLLIPIACVSYYPIATLLQREKIPFFLGMAAPLMGFIFLYLTFQLWHFGVRYYRSTGS